MSARLRSSRIVAFVIALSILPLAGVVTAAPPPALAAVATDYPSWQDVAAAQSSERAAQAAVTQIKALLAQLAAEVEATQAEAMAKGAIYEEKQAAADEQAFITEKLQTQADDAKLKADESKRKASAMLAELGKTGGGDLTASLLASSQSGDADDLLYRLGAMSQYTERSQDVYTQAIQEKNNADALTEQANIAHDKLEELSAAALGGVPGRAGRRHRRSGEARASRRPTRPCSRRSSRCSSRSARRPRRTTSRACASAGDRTPAASSASRAGPGPSSGYVSSGFGMRYHPIYHDWIMHNGTDIAGQGCGATIFAAHAGTVTYAGPNGTLGNYIQIEHGDGTSSGYGHIMPGGIHVYIGQNVDPGQPIAQVGTTGASTGCHLHFMIRVGGQLTNPVPFMSARGITIA